MIEAPSAGGIVPSRSEEVDSLQCTNSLTKEIELIGSENENGGIPLKSSINAERDAIVEVCRVCQCAEPDEGGEAALKFLGISFPSHASHQKTNVIDGVITEEGEHKLAVDSSLDSHSSIGIHECISDSKAGLCVSSADSLIELGCACRSDLALAHYACALKWFVSRGSLICEICKAPAVNISIVDRNKVLSILKENDARQTQQAQVDSAESSSNSYSTSRVKLSEVISWFDPHGNTVSSLLGSNSEQVVDIPDEGLITSVSPATQWAVEGTGILIATGLLTVTITWLLAPRVGRLGVARKGLNVFLGGLCALSIVVFLRFSVLPRIKYGPARYWAILVVFWFLVFGVWASSTRNSRSNT